MLQLRPNCENCNKALPANALDARICSYECTFCAECVENILQNICPNCTGGFVPRPIRPKAQLIKDPASQTQIHKPADLEKQKQLIAKFSSLPPEER